MERQQGIQVLKRDSFGRIERCTDRDGHAFVRRVACGGRIPGSALVARILLERERRALRQLAGLDGVPKLVEGDLGDGSSDERALDARSSLARSWIDGVPLSETTSLREDFFDELDRLVEALHARGVCHNDLHKEQNVLVGRDGLPFVVDFQLASRHAAASRTFATRAREDLRHVEKHRGRYTRHGKGPRGERTFGRGAGTRRSSLAHVWRRIGKPVYHFITRTVLRTRDGEKRRPASGPWPAWTPPQRISSR